MNTNELKIAEIKGVLTVKASYSLQRKYMNRRSVIQRKTDKYHQWKEEIFEEYVKSRLEIHIEETADNSQNAEDEVRAIMDAEERSESSTTYGKMLVNPMDADSNF
ncbi:hypothetical protein Aduo_002193 [Ancylostoma duodenale]